MTSDKCGASPICQGPAEFHAYQETYSSMSCMKPVHRLLMKPLHRALFGIGNQFDPTFKKPPSLGKASTTRAFLPSASDSNLQLRLAAIDAKDNQQFVQVPTPRAKSAPPLETTVCCSASDQSPPKQVTSANPCRSTYLLPRA